MIKFILLSLLLTSCSVTYSEQTKPILDKALEDSVITKDVYQYEIRRLEKIDSIICINQKYNVY